MSRETRYNSLRRAGFLDSEAKALSHISRNGMQAPYVQRMVQSRRGLLWNARRYNWSDTRYRNAIRQLYIDKGALKKDKLGRVKIDAWQLLRWYQDRTPQPEAYESPWVTRARKRSGTRRTIKTTSRRQMLRSWLDGLTRSIESTNNPARKAKLQSQYENVRRQLRDLGE